MEAGFQKSHGHGCVQKIRRDDGNKIHALACGQGRLGPGHFRIAAIHALWIQEKLFAGGLRIFYIRRESARNEFDLTIEIGGHAVDGADKCALSAADHAVPDFTFGWHNKMTWEAPLYKNSFAPTSSEF